jgi:hypothetical protein
MDVGREGTHDQKRSNFSFQQPWRKIENEWAVNGYNCGAGGQMEIEIAKYNYSDVARSFFKSCYLLCAAENHL